MAEWLRRWTANPMGSVRVSSNLILVGVFSHHEVFPIKKFLQTWMLTFNHQFYLQERWRCHSKRHREEFIWKTLSWRLSWTGFERDFSASMKRWHPFHLCRTSKLSVWAKLYLALASCLPTFRRLAMYISQWDITLGIT